MKLGFVKVAAVTPKIKVADTTYNGELIRGLMKETADAGAKVVVFPELCITGYTCGDLFLQDRLIVSAKKELMSIVKMSEGLDAIFFVGLPYEINGKLYNVAAVVCNGEVLGIVPKTYLPNYSEFYEARHFTIGEGLDLDEMLPNGQIVPVSTDLIFYCSSMPQLKIAVEICEDMWTPLPPSISHALSGATVIANLSASNETAGKCEYRRQLIAAQSGRLTCGYIYVSAGEGESTQDMVFGGHNIIAEGGAILAESKKYENGIIYSEIDVAKMEGERRRKNTFNVKDDHVFVPFSLGLRDFAISRYISQSPFVPEDEATRKSRCEDIFYIQSMGLKKRIEHTNTATAVIGISGGLDSTLALLVTVRAFDMLQKDRKDIVAVTMPGFGTTDRTYDNAVSMIKNLGVSFVEVDIKKSVLQHFEDIGHDKDTHDVTYENSQARERTQILMDIANRRNGMVIGTGDLSELALGWATYNGDHMSMYGVNASVPKTLVRHLVNYYADTCGDETLCAVLKDVLDTPVSPELLPPDSGKIAQKTEDLVGPYELHDFFLYYVLRHGFAPKKIYEIAKVAYAVTYENEIILHWLKVFYRRFFSQQFKRSCLPDGPKVGSISMSPRGDWRMPSDASGRIWLDELENL
ncbi:MAG: NAD(+) synthase [Agathobacter sp.]|nr:NAD(+) synthase [Agathobacter sp.]